MEGWGPKCRFFKIYGFKSFLNVSDSFKFNKFMLDLTNVRCKLRYKGRGEARVRN